MRKKLTLDMGEQHDAWQRFAASHGERPATLARKVLLLVLKEHQAADAPAKPTDCGKRGIFIRLNADELAHLDSYAQQMKCTRSKAIIGIIRAAIAAEPQFSGDEIKELSRSNYQLAKIGVNLNQITRRLNGLNLSDFRQAGKLQPLIEAMAVRVSQVSEAITKHSAMVWAVINSGRYRLSIKGKRK